MNLNQLCYFRVLVEEKQYTKAASKLFISQPSLSNSMKSFEEELGGKLLKKNGHQMQLTQFGKSIYETICTSLDELDHGISEAQKLLNQQPNTIKIACLPTTFGTVLPKIIRDFKESINKSTHFILSSKASIPVMNGLTKEAFDVGICSYKSGYDDLKFIPFYAEEIIVLVPKEHKLAKVKKVTLSQLNHQNIITYTPEIPIGETIEKDVLSKLSNINNNNKQIDEVGIAGLVASGQGVGICADTSFLAPFDLAKIPLKIPANTRIVYVAYNNSSPRSKEVESFIRFILDYDISQFEYLIKNKN
ncbi:LysR family transcriptional regulator [Agrilactobacillus yilanensis]|uniref:LysR family transcriptional regulator n=1 Tax=Agrilactobacillus yilanensis TaxID=2485997 RepID=A0ABW4JA37_9LACO|nr:LysR family transcriptional regulator [Agrilactobacillus yilanensis]